MHHRRLTYHRHFVLGELNVELDEMRTDLCIVLVLVCFPA